MTIGVHLNTTATKEHVPEVEQQIRVVKECTGAVTSTMIQVSARANYNRTHQVVMIARDFSS